VTVAVSPPDVPIWGAYQFPRLSRLPDGRILLTYGVNADEVTSHGLPSARVVSDDEGATWTHLPMERTPSEPPGMLTVLPNGDALSAAMSRPIPVSKLRVPAEPFARIVVNKKEEQSVYLLKDLPPECAVGWALHRLPAGETEWREERGTVRCTGDEVRFVDEEYGLMVLPRFQGRLRVAPDGALWCMSGLFQTEGGELADKWPLTVLRSTDSGRNWDVHSAVPYAPDRGADPDADKRNGFGEPEVEFLPDGSAFALMRTTNPYGPAPSYWTRSTDNGVTWSPPSVFDDCGVRPRLLTLKNGVTLASYGRPGLYLRATADPDGQNWDPRITIIEPSPCKLGHDTCSYTGLLALSDHTALLAYSEFDLHRADGKRIKKIRVRKVAAARRM